MSADFNASRVVWKSEYNIGNLQIDKEHQNLFLLARKALNIKMTHSEDEVYCELKEIITQLYRYINIHFANEEAYMHKIHYVDLKHHRQIHKNIIQQLNNLILELNQMELAMIKEKLFEFMTESFVKHIMTEDKKIQLWNTPVDDLKKEFGWKAIYIIGDDQIDEEHRYLFEIAQEAFETVEFTDERNEKIKKVLTKLYNYLKTHLSHEEAFMEQLNYPKLEEHKEIHQDMIHTFNDFVKQLPSMDGELFEKELMKLIDIILVQHIIQEDKKIINWIKANKTVAVM